jgi:hypothetical protein
LSLLPALLLNHRRYFPCSEGLKKSIESGEEQLAAVAAAVKGWEEEVEQVQLLVQSADEEVKAAESEVKKQKEVLGKQNAEINAKTRRAEEVKKVNSEKSLEIQELEHNIKGATEAKQDADRRVKHMLEDYDWIQAERQFFGQPNSIYDFKVGMDMVQVYGIALFSCGNCLDDYARVGYNALKYVNVTSRYHQQTSSDVLLYLKMKFFSLQQNLDIINSSRTYFYTFIYLILYLFYLFFPFSLLFPFFIFLAFSHVLDLGGGRSVSYFNTVPFYKGIYSMSNANFLTHYVGTWEALVDIGTYGSGSESFSFSRCQLQNVPYLKFRYNYPLANDTAVNPFIMKGF